MLTGSAPETFLFGLSPIRVVVIEGLPWFVGNNVAWALQLSDPRQALGKLDADERGGCLMPTPGGPQMVRVVNESGLYALIMRCRDASKPGTTPHHLRKFVTSKVLPSIRRTGSYGAPAPVAAPTAAALIEALKNPATALEVIRHYTTANLALQQRVEAAQPAVDFCEALADSNGTWGLQAAGKALRQDPNWFVAWLRERGDLFDLNGGPVANQALIDRELLTVVREEHGGKPRPETRVIGKGIVFYAKALGVRPPGPPSQAPLPGL